MIKSKEKITQIDFFDFFNFSNDIFNNAELHLIVNVTKYLRYQLCHS